MRSHFSGHQADLIVSPLFWQYYGWQVYLQLVPLGFAATTSQFLTDIAKYSIGRLRPHFIDLCRPQLPNGLVMDRFSNCQNPHTYVTTYSCTNYHLSERRIKDGHLSFMSGHSSFAAVCLIYLIVSSSLKLLITDPNSRIFFLHLDLHSTSPSESHHWHSQEFLPGVSFIFNFLHGYESSI